MYNIFYQSHAGSWAILILFFVLSYFFQKQKWLPMITRLFYLIMLISGIGLLFILKFPLLFIIKGILAIGLIGLMEAILGKRKRGEQITTLWIILIILAILVILLGFGIISF